MLLTRYQTPEVQHEENWWQLVHLAYLQLWVAKEYARSQPRPWERYLPQMQEKFPSPAMVQRNFERDYSPVWDTRCHSQTARLFSRPP